MSCRTSYKPSFPVLMGIAVLFFLLGRSDLPRPAYVITFMLILLLPIADTLRWEMQEGVEHEKQS